MFEVPATFSPIEKKTPIHLARKPKKKKIPAYKLKGCCSDYDFCQPVPKKDKKFFELKNTCMYKSDAGEDSGLFTTLPGPLLEDDVVACTAIDTKKMCKKFKSKQVDGTRTKKCYWDKELEMCKTKRAKCWGLYHGNVKRGKGASDKLKCLDTGRYYAKFKQKVSDTAEIGDDIICFNSNLKKLPVINKHFLKIKKLNKQVQNAATGNKNIMSTLNTLNAPYNTHGKATMIHEDKYTPGGPHREFSWRYLDCNEQQFKRICVDTDNGCLRRPDAKSKETCTENSCESTTIFGKCSSGTYTNAYSKGALGPNTEACENYKKICNKEWKNWA